MPWHLRSAVFRTCGSRAHPHQKGHASEVFNHYAIGDQTEAHQPADPPAPMGADHQTHWHPRVGCDFLTEAVELVQLIFSTSIATGR